MIIKTRRWRRCGYLYHSSPSFTLNLSLTMGDDEFFSNSRTSLTLGELVAFSRALFNIAFALYWRGDQTKIQEGRVPGLNLRWVGVRRKIKKCLQAIHARE
jgi:ubiquitin-protein ligase E3 C